MIIEGDSLPECHHYWVGQDRAQQAAFTVHPKLLRCKMERGVDYKPSAAPQCLLQDPETMYVGDDCVTTKCIRDAGVNNHAMPLIATELVLVEFYIFVQNTHLLKTLTVLLSREAKRFLDFVS